MENLKLETEIRTDSGKGAAHKLRAVGSIPGVLYGHKEEAVSLVVKETAIRAILHSHPESAVIDLDVKGGKSKGSEVFSIRPKTVDETLLKPWPLQNALNSSVKSFGVPLGTAKW